jgi:hypothetical protein
LDYVVGQLVATGGVLEGAADRLFVLQLVGQLFEFVLAEASDQLVEDGGRRLQQLEEDAAVVVAAIVLLKPPLPFTNKARPVLARGEEQVRP